jgi:hypothetical protein
MNRAALGKKKGDSFVVTNKRACLMQWLLVLLSWRQQPSLFGALPAMRAVSPEH